ncbi:MAG: hypothetical protein IJ193_04185, partial [Bacilli bacterium]|nr:hypothetical protein [Bacilli bacterium]
LWFMITLTTYNILEYIFDKVSGKIMIPLSILIGVFSGFIPSIGLELSLSRTCTFLPFYTIGYYSRNIDLMELRDNKTIKYLSLFASIICIYFLFESNKIFSLSLLKGATSYYEISGALWLLPIRRFASYLMAGIISIAFMVLVPKEESFFTTLGKNTLYIYLTQGMVLKTFVTNHWMISNSIIGSILLFGITLFLTTIFAIIIPKLKQKIGGVIDGRESKSFA